MVLEAILFREIGLETIDQFRVSIKLYFNNSSAVNLRRRQLNSSPSAVAEEVGSVVQKLTRGCWFRR